MDAASWALAQSIMEEDRHFDGAGATPSSKRRRARASDEEDAGWAGSWSRWSEGWSDWGRGQSADREEEHSSDSEVEILDSAPRKKRRAAATPTSGPVEASRSPAGERKKEALLTNPVFSDLDQAFTLKASERHAPLSLKQYYESAAFCTLRRIILILPPRPPPPPSGHGAYDPAARRVRRRGWRRQVRRVPEGVREQAQGGQRRRRDAVAARRGRAHFA